VSFVPFRQTPRVSLLIREFRGSHFSSPPRSRRSSNAAGLHSPKITKLGYGANFGQEAKSVQHRPYFDALAIGESVDVDSGSRNQLSGSPKPEKVTAMGAAKREAVDHLFGLGNDVLDSIRTSGNAFSRGSPKPVTPGRIRLENPR